MARTHINGTEVNLWSMLLDQYQWNAPTGNIWWVSNAGGLGIDAAPPGQGRSPGAPFSTLAFALSQAVLNNGDVIALCPNHAETLTGPAFVNANKAGVRIVGLGIGRERPTFSYSTAIGASFDVNAANVSLANLVFVGTGFAAITAMLNVKAANCLIEDCEIEFANSTNQAVLAILTTAAADRLRIRRCHIHGTNNAGCTAAISLVGGTDIVLEDLDVIGSFTPGVGGIRSVTSDCTNLILKNSRITNLTAVNTKAATFTALTSGTLSDLRAAILSGVAPVTAAGMNWAGNNRYTNALGASDIAF